MTLALVVLAIVIARSAWMGDDAYLTLRTIDNIVHGHGAVWNPGERVQAYTHPLWMLVLLVPYALVREAFVMPMVVGLSLSVTAAWVLARGWKGAPLYALLAVLALMMSRSYVDYSTSGLENPLTHLLLACFLVGYNRWDGSRKALTYAFLLAALIATNRLDVILLVAPALLVLARGVSLRTFVRSAAIGGLPLLAWESFSLIYYGSFVPNTALSKLSHGIPAEQLWGQGWVYVIRQLEFDPLSATLVAAAIVVGLRRARKDPKTAAVALGIAAYVLYIAKVGGDFMAGRFFTAPTLAAIWVLVTARLQHLQSSDATTARHDLVLGGVGIVVVGMMAETPTFAGLDGPQSQLHEGIVDERRFWQRPNQLIGLRGNRKGPYHGLTYGARDMRKTDQKLAVLDAVGMFGFYVGADVTVVDRYALGDAFLARLPAVAIEPWRPGHFGRFVPPGYIETLETKESHLLDENLAELWSALQLVISGPLFSAERWRAIWKFNTGGYDDLVDRAFYKEPYHEAVPLRVLSRVQSNGSLWNVPGSLYVHPDDGLRVDIGRVAHEPTIALSADANDAYRLTFLRDGREVGASEYDALSKKARRRKHGLQERTVAVDPAAVQAGYDAILLERNGKDRRLSIGHLLLQDDKSSTRSKRKKSGKQPAKAVAK